MENVNKTTSMVMLQKLRKKCHRDSSSDSSSDEEILMKMANKIEHEKHEKIKNFVEEIVLRYTPSDFQKHFRISRTKCEELLIVLKPENIECGRRTPYPLLDGLLLTIWTLATQESFREVGSRFNVSEGHAYRILMKYCTKMTQLKDNYIVLPKGQQRQKHIQEFDALRGEHSFPNVFGCVDGTHIPIPGPKGDNSYYNRKGFHSLQLQGICDAKAKFINIFCGWPGSVHDSRVWRSCQIYKKLEENSLELLPAGSYLLGDSAYPLAKYLITPFKDSGNLTRKQKIFNAKLSSKRVIIEQAFGRLKGMFRRLKYLNILKLSNAKYILITACILHNLCIDDFYNEELSENDDQINPGVDPEEENENEDKEAVQFRNEIMNNIC